MKTFRTEITPQQQNLNFTHQSKVMLLGSCFSDNIGDRLDGAYFKTLVNPHGIVFNPLSVAHCLDDYLLGKKYTTADLIARGNDFVSLQHHGAFAGENPKELVERINNKISNGHDFLQSSEFLIVTLGTSWTYFYRSTKKAVANCHKIPGSEFEKKLILSQETVDVFQEIFERIKTFNPNLKIILTVSPVRHWKDGVVENNLSKSHLVVAANQLVEDNQKVYYFPSYEIMMDDLRDYRFYNEDMLHPSPLAVDYIWQKFQETYFDVATQNKVEKIEKLAKIFTHRPKNLPEHQKQKELAQKKIQEIIGGRP